MNKFLLTTAAIVLAAGSMFAQKPAPTKPVAAAPPAAAAPALQPIAMDDSFYRAYIQYTVLQSLLQEKSDILTAWEKTHKVPSDYTIDLSKRQLLPPVSPAPPKK